MIKALLSVLGILLVFYYGLIYKSVPITLIGFALIVLMITSYIYITYILRKITVRIKIPIAIAQTDRPVKVTIDIINKSKLPIKKIKIKLNCLVNYSETYRKCFVVNNIMPGNNSYDTYLQLNVTGNYEIGFKKYYIYDLTGIWSRVKKASSGENVIILPVNTDVSITLSQRIYNYFSDSDYYDELRPGYDPNEVFDVREYRDGDKLRSIHWKISAKKDELYVKENSLPKGCPVVIFIDADSFTDSRIVDSISNVSFSLMDNKCSHYACWYSAGQKEIIRARIDDEESYYLFMTTFMRDLTRENNIPLTEQYKNKYRGDQYLYGFIYNKNGLTIGDTTFSPDKLDELELVL